MSDTLDTEAFTLFRAGCSQPSEWVALTDRQKSHWRAVAANAREIHATPRPSRDEMAEIIRVHWVENWAHPNYPTAVRCMAPDCDWEGRFPGDIADHVADLIASDCTP